MNRRTIYLLGIALTIILGVASRVFHTGILLIDKYLGDALYAILVYLLLALAWPRARVWRRAAVSSAIMLAVETFQLTLVPDRLARSGNLALRLLAIALGTTFSWRDLAAYAVGIAVFALLDRYGSEAKRISVRK